MYNNFAAQYAPEVALPPYGEFDTPETDAGLTPPEHLYDSNGTPLNYIQSQGGQREFLVPRGQQVFSAPSTPNTTQAPIRLRGRGQQIPDYPLGPNTDAQPQNLMRPDMPSATARIPPMQSQSPPVQGQSLPYQGLIRPPTPSATVRIPPSQSQPPVSGNTQQRTMEDQITTAAFAERNMQNRVADAAVAERVLPSTRSPVTSIQNEFNAGTAGGLGTLQRLIEDSQFGGRLSEFISRIQGRPLEGPRRRGASGSLMESNLRGMSDPHDNLSFVDSEPTGAVPTVTPTSSVRWNGAVTQVGPYEQTGRAEEVAAMLRAHNIRVTSVTRTNNASRGGHDQGNSIDVDPQDRIRAMNLIARWYPGLTSESFDISAGQRFGRNVRSTGHHGHIDLGPVAGPRRRAANNTQNQ